MMNWVVPQVLHTHRKSNIAMEDPAFTRPGYVKIAIENDHLWIYLQKMVIFHSYVNVYQRVYQILL